ncbi:MAG: GNAT family N-acetyltransferase, partial [Oscillospiraceae bacterium]|nr:GNAT family N-acetyltransferase [Oscillospiraceae bacterium]
MEYGLNLHTGAPLRGRLLAQLRDFLAKSGLRYDEGIEFSAVIQNAEGAIVASASLQEGVIKCVAVDPAMQGEGLTATLLTAVRQEAMQRGHRRLFLYTKPENRMLFAPLGFHAVAATAKVLLMEDRPGGFAAWAESIRAPAAHGTVGSIVMNCNPMTNGHRYLIETAAAQCDFLYLFILSEDKSAVPTANRLRLVRETL